MRLLRVRLCLWEHGQKYLELSMYDDERCDTEHDGD